MATYFTGNDGNGVALGANGDLWINAAGTFVTNAGVAFDFGQTQFNRLMVYGSVISENDDAISAADNAVDVKIEVMAGGVVSGYGDGIALQDSGHEIYNYGTIAGLGSAGVELGGDLVTDANSSRLVNYGDITGTTAGIETDGTMAMLVNAGTVQGGATGVVMADSDFGLLTNSGTIHGLTTGVLLSSAATATNTIVNTGTISGGFLEAEAINGSAGAEIVRNGGTLVGSVTLDDGADVVRNSGTIEGVVDLSAGADLYAARGEGNAVAVRGGLGADVLSGAAADDVLFGNEDADALRGGAGGDSLDGGAGGDTLRGNDGADELWGGEGADQLFGGAGDDALDGGRQNDRMFGGSGADTFAIGPNNDTDVIRDFERGVDTLDLTAWDFATLADAVAAGSNVDGNAVFAFGGNDQVTLEGVTVAQIAGDLLI